MADYHVLQNVEDTDTVQSSVNAHNPVTASYQENDRYDTYRDADSDSESLDHDQSEHNLLNGQQRTTTYVL